jgi:hypothetical protein
MNPTNTTMLEQRANIAKTIIAFIEYMNDDLSKISDLMLYDDYILSFSLSPYELHVPDIEYSIHAILTVYSMSQSIEDLLRKYKETYQPEAPHV